MKLILAIVLGLLLASCHQVREVRMSDGSIVKMATNDDDVLRYGNYVWIDTVGQKEPYPLVGFITPLIGHAKTAIQVEVLNPAK